MKQKIDNYLINGQRRRVPGFDALSAQVDHVHLYVRTLVGDDSARRSADVAGAHAANVLDCVEKWMHGLIVARC